MYDSNFFTFSLDAYGLTIRTDAFYISITWGILALIVSGLVMRKVLKARKRSR